MEPEIGYRDRAATETRREFILLIRLIFLTDFQN